MACEKEDQDAKAEHPAAERLPDNNDYLPLPLFIGRRVEHVVEEEPSFWLRLRGWLSRIF